MSAELVRRAAEELIDDKLFRSWINDLEEVIAEREARIRDLEKECYNLRQRVRDLEALAVIPTTGTSVSAPMEFTETPGTYVPISKPTTAEQRVREALLRIDATTIKEWEETEQMLRQAGQGLLPGEVDDSDSK